MAPVPTLRPVAKAVLRTQSDSRLVALVRDGSDDAFAEIVRRHRPGLVRMARSLGSAERSEDVVQDSLVRAWRAIRSSDAEIDLKPWLATIVRNRARSAHAATRHHDELDETIDGVPRPPDIVLMQEELRSTVSAVNALPDTQREAIVRSALRGESHEQIATALETTPGAVRQLIFRARTGLREAVGVLIPAPLVRQLVELSARDASGPAAAVAASAGGGSMVFKGAALVLIGAAAAGSGIALDRGGRQDPRERDTVASTDARAGHHGPGPPAAQTAAGGTGDQAGAGGGQAGESTPGSGGGGGPDDGIDGSGGGPAGDSAGSGGGSSSGPSSADDSGGGSEDGHGGPGGGDLSGSSGPGDDSFTHGGGDGGSGSSGPGSGELEGSGSGSSGGGGSSGPGDGSSTSGSDDPPSTESGSTSPDSSGSGSGSSGSGSSGSGGSGSGEDLPERELGDPLAGDGSIQAD